MSENEQTTIEKIHSTAKAEFLQKGFRSASLRNIVKEAGVTTGAFYGYYKSKEELFDALVSEQYQTFMGMFQQAQNEFAALPPEKQVSSMKAHTDAYLLRMLDYIYDHMDVFRLLLCSSEGTRYENMVHEMVEIEVNATHAFASVMEGMGREAYHIDPMLEHLLVSGMFSGFFELVIHEIPYEKAVTYLHELHDFYTAGWQRIMGF